MNTNDMRRLEFERNDRCTLLIRQMKTHHKETYLHSARVALYTSLLADAMNFTKQEQEVIYRSSWLHDIGVLNIPTLILDHAHTDNDLYMSHCESGLQLISQWGDDTWVDMDMIQYHHENLDGTGYYGRTWKQLSTPTRLIRVTDSYDKMTRYSNKYDNDNMDIAFEELFRWSDVIYDSEVVQQFYQIVKSTRRAELKPYSKQ